MTVGQECALEARKELDEERRKAFDKNGLTFDRLIRELKSIAFSDMADYVTIDEGGALQCKPLASISKPKRAAIKKIKEKTNIAESADGKTIFKTSKIEYELYDKLSGLQNILKLRNDYPSDKLDIDATGEITVNIVKFAQGAE